MSAATQIHDQLTKTLLNPPTGTGTGGGGDNLIVSILKPYFNSIQRGNDTVTDDAFKALNDRIESHPEEMSKVICSDENKLILKELFKNRDDVDNFVHSKESEGVPHELKECIKSLYPANTGGNPQHQTGGVEIPFSTTTDVNVKNAALKTALGASSFILGAIGGVVYLTRGIPIILAFDILTGDNIEKFGGSIFNLASAACNASKELTVLEEKIEKQTESQVDKSTESGKSRWGAFFKSSVGSVGRIFSRNTGNPTGSTTGNPTDSKPTDDTKKSGFLSSMFGTKKTPGGKKTRRSGLLKKRSKKSRKHN